VLQGTGQEYVAVLVGGGVEGVGWGRGAGESFEQGGRRETVVPLGVLRELVGSENAGGVLLWKDEGAEEDTLGLAGGVVVVGADAFDALGGGLLELLAEDGGVDAEFLRGVGGELVALDAIGHAADVGEEEVEGFDFGVSGAAGELFAGVVDEEVGVAFGVAERGHVGLDALLAEEAVGVEAAFEGDDLDFEVLFGEERDGFFCGGDAGGVGVEVDDDALGEAAEEADLHLGEGGAGGGDDVLNSGHVDGDAVHLAFDEESEAEGANVGLGFVEVEEDLALAVKGGLGGVEVLGDVSAFFVLGVEGAGGEGDGLALFVGDGEGDAFAEAGIELAMGSVGLLFGTEEAAGAEDFVGEVFGQLLAHVVEVVGGVADAKFSDGVRGDAAACEVLARAGSFRGFEGGFEVLCCGFVDVEELATEAGFVSFLGGAELPLGEGDAALGGDDADGLGEADVLHLHDEGEDVALFVAAETVEVAVGRVDGEGAGLFFVEGAEAGVVLGSGFAELEVVADDPDDVGLLLDELGEVIGHVRGASPE
jgi:hypothetical protein